MQPLLILLPGLALLAAPPGPHPRPPAAPFSPAAAAARPPAKAPAQAPPVESDDCLHQGLPFKVSLVKVAGAEAPDDLALVLEQRGRRLEARLPGQPAARWWKLGPLVAGPDWKAPKTCNRVESVPTTAGRLLLFALADGRPGADHLQGILYEVRGQRVLDVVDLGPFAALEAFTEGAAFVRQGVLVEAGGDRLDPLEAPLPLPGGDTLAAVSADVSLLNPVLRVWTAGNRIHTRPDAERTWRAATAAAPALARAFAGARPFAEAFALSSPTPRLAYRTARTAKGWDCVQPTGPDSREDWRRHRWYCAAAP